MAVLGWLLGCLTMLALGIGIPSENYREERRFLNSVGRGDCIAMFEKEEIELNQILNLFPGLTQHLQRTSQQQKNVKTLSLLLQECSTAGMSELTVQCARKIYRLLI